MKTLLENRVGKFHSSKKSNHIVLWGKKKKKSLVRVFSSLLHLLWARVLTLLALFSRSTILCSLVIIWDQWWGDLVWKWCSRLSASTFDICSWLRYVFGSVFDLLNGRIFEGLYGLSRYTVSFCIIILESCCGNINNTCRRSSSLHSLCLRKTCTKHAVCYRLKLYTKKK